MTGTVITHPDNHEPVEFTLALLDWLPWLEPPAETALTERQRASLVDAARSNRHIFAFWHAIRISSRQGPAPKGYLLQHLIRSAARRA